MRQWLRATTPPPVEVFLLFLDTEGATLRFCWSAVTYMQLAGGVVVMGAVR